MGLTTGKFIRLWGSSVGRGGGGTVEVHFRISRGITWFNSAEWDFTKKKHRV